MIPSWSSTPTFRIDGGRAATAELLSGSAVDAAVRSTT